MLRAGQDPVNHRIVYMWRTLALMMMWLGSLGWLGCQSRVGLGGRGTELGPENNSQDPGANEAQSDNSQALSCQTPESPELLRLSRYEYINTLSDLVGVELVKELEVTLRSIPNDLSPSEFDRLSQTLTVNHISGYFEVAKSVAEHFSENASERATLFSCIENDSPSVDCISEFIKDLSRRAFRRPATAEEIEILQNAYDSAENHAEGIASFLIVLLQSPPFLFHEEFGTGDAMVDDDRGRPLSDFEIANRLSYLLWGRPPDAELRGAADRGELKEEVQFIAQRDRLLRHENTRSHLKHYVRQWLEIDFISNDLDGVPPHVASSKELQGLSTAMDEEIVRVVDHIIWNGGTFRDLMTTNVSFLTSSNLAKIYGVTPAPDLDTPLELNPEERSGLLTRLMFLARTRAVASPIHRGVLILNKFFCMDLEPPDLVEFPKEAFEPPPMPPTATTRQFVEAQTVGGENGQPLKKECLGCHQQINPLGFAFEGYDGIGRVRTQEWKVDADGNPIKDEDGHPLVDEDGNPVAVDINDVVEVPLLESKSVAGGVELSQAIGHSKDASRCFVENLMEYFLSKKLHTQADHCNVDVLTEALVPANEDYGIGILEIISRLTELPGFRYLRHRKP